MFTFYILEDIIFTLNHRKSLQIEEESRGNNLLFTKVIYLHSTSVQKGANFNTLNYCKKREFFTIIYQNCCPVHNFYRIMVKFSQQPRHILGHEICFVIHEISDIRELFAKLNFPIFRIFKTQRIQLREFREFRESRNICYAPGYFWVTVKIVR